MINDEILTFKGFNKSTMVRLVGPDSEQLGVVKLSEALEKAEEFDLDLALLAPQSTPPVCRIMNYGKYKFDKVKKDKEAKKNQSDTKIKGMRLFSNTDVGDLNTKINSVIKFLQAGNKVKVSLLYKRRQIAHSDLAKNLMQKFADGCSEYGTIEKGIQQEGRNMYMTLVPIKQTNDKKGANNGKN